MNKKVKIEIYVAIGFLFLIGILMFNFISAIQITQFNNSLSSENLTFYGDENITRYLEINRYANVTSAYMNLSGYPEVNETTYQETADATACEGTWANPPYSCVKTMDGDWDSYGFGTSPFEYVFSFENYTIPANTLNAIVQFKSLWELGSIGFYCFNSDEVWEEVYFRITLGLITENTTIPVGCLTGSVLQIKTYLRSPGDQDDNRNYEQAVYWVLGGYVNNPYLEIGTPDGIYEWSLRGAEFQDKNAILDELNDTSTIKNLTYTGDENQTVYLKIPKHSNVTSAYLNLSGYLGLNETTYQETADAGTACEGTWANPPYSCAETMDGDWDSYGKKFDERESVVSFENYTIPVDMLNATVQFKSMNGAGNMGFACLNSAGDWTAVHSSPFGINIENTTIPETCLNGSVLQIKSFLNDGDLNYYEQAVYWGEGGYSNNPYLEIGTPDGIYEWNHSGEFNSTFSPNKTSDFSSAINTYLSTCSADSENYCEVPLLLHSDTAGILQISAIEITYTNISKTLDFYSALNSALNNGACDCTGCSLDGDNCTIPFLFHSDTAGNLEYSSIDINLLETVSPTYSNAQANTTVAGATILFSILYDDNIALHPKGQWIFSTNNTGTWVNDSAVNFTSTPSSANVTKTLNSTVGMVVGYRWYADDDAGNVNNTEIFTLTITAADTCTAPESGNWAIDCSDGCNITSAINLNENNISIIGVGTFTTNVSIYNWTNLFIQGTDSSNRCVVTCKQGGCFD